MEKFLDCWLVISHVNYGNRYFAIIKRLDCSACGLFSDYIVYLGCINYFLNKGFIPIIDLQSFKNIYNGYNISKTFDNPWEYFFYQPFGYSLNIVKKKFKNIKYFQCKIDIFRPNISIFFNKILNNYWHNISKNYASVKKNILYEANKIIINLFKDSKNILGILMRGTDYIARKPKGHPIPPTPSMVIKDIKEINTKNKYDWFFISTEDDLIRDIFIKEFGYKIKYLISKKINYDYNKKLFLSENIKGNIQYIKIYLLNMIILSKCIDIISSQTSGAIGVFILSEGFRYSKVYNLGTYF